jgi:hypothetical protein
MESVDLGLPRMWSRRFPSPAASRPEPTQPASVTSHGDAMGTGLGGAQGAGDQGVDDGPPASSAILVDDRGPPAQPGAPGEG